MARISVVFLSLLGLCSLLTILSASSNRNLPKEDRADTLGPVDQARLLEAMHLKATLGDQAWQGWGRADIPVILWNRAYEFLANYDGEAPGDWSVVETDDLGGQPYFRQPADNPQNFAVPVGDIWVASMATKQTTDHFLIETFQDMFPAPLKQIFPYRILIQPSETQIGGLLHETFHVYQYQLAPARIAQAESFHKLGESYEETASVFQREWKKESALLADALEANTQNEKIELVRQFLDTRDARRKEHKLGEELVDYERWLEWEEGTAKYLEVGILKKAGETAGYQPLPEMKNDADFKQYQRINQRWSQELYQLRHPMASGETRFYMTGMAQSFLLDDLLPGWQEQYWQEDVFLEDLLRIAVGENG